MHKLFVVVNQAIQLAQVCAVPGCCVALGYF